MHRILLVEDRPEHSLLYALNLQLYVGAEVIFKKNIAETLAFFQTKKPHPVDLIVSQSSSPRLASELTMGLKKLNVEVPILSAKQTGGEDKKAQLANLLKATAGELGITSSVMAAQKVEEFYSLSINYFIPGLKVSCSVYAQLGEGKYSEILSSGETISKEIIHPLKKQSVAQLYVQKEHRLAFGESVAQQLISIINSKNSTVEEKLFYSEKALKLSHDKARSLGIDDETLELADASINNMVALSMKIPNLAILIKMLLADDLSYRFKHSHLVTYIAFHLIKHLDKSFQEQGDKLAMAAFYQDLALSTDEMGKMKSGDDVQSSRLSSKEKNIVLKHAHMAAEVLERHHQIPSDVVAIVRQHHGVASGKGLGAISPHITPLSAVFVVAEKWADLVIKFEQRPIKLSREKVIRFLSNELEFPIFRKILPLLATLEL